MGNETEKNQQNPGQRPSNPGNQADPNRQNPTAEREACVQPAGSDLEKAGPGQRHN